MNRNRTLAPLLLALAVILPAAAEGTSSLTVPISLSGITGSLTVTLDDLTGLNLANLGVTTRLVSPFDLVLLSRLPPNVSLALAFPVLVRIEPPVDGGLAFTGATSVELQSVLNPLFPILPLRLFSAPLDGSFQDITQSRPNNKSYRALGATGGFSEFLIVFDLTPRHQVIANKLNRLDQILADNAAAIDPTVLATLSAEVAAIRADFLAGNNTAASDDVDVFLATVDAHSGTDIPNVWRATRDLVDVAGKLEAGGLTLRFSLEQGFLL